MGNKDKISSTGNPMIDQIIGILVISWIKIKPSKILGP